MTRYFTILPVFILAGALLTTLAIAEPLQDNAESNDWWCSAQRNIEKYLGRPYAIGAVGKKSFDCSGFVWRILAENGIMLKRTTARKLYMCLPSAAKNRSYDSGSLVFFDNMKHVGIVKNQESFYHAQVSKGTTLSKFDPYWRHKIYGFKKIPTR
ncbi:MAG: hypothetical protein COX19_03470 [Desulfobacterales bacterium CG23_combo_of_CG06-09_8_20_14_all_51_8]|nr:MAG: hypothetical protein COX19_03470 [Desulfobacterales bacterium CG23_combo_of_CG06-09_8_20_14_all_51_8]